MGLNHHGKKMEFPTSGKGQDQSMVVKDSLTNWSSGLPGLQLSPNLER